MERSGEAGTGTSSFIESRAPSTGIGEVCPTWPGQPICAHWGVVDPVTFAGSGDAKRGFFLRLYKELEHRIKIFASLPLDTLERLAVERRVKEIGQLRLAG
jgi:hypothetical protein